MVTPIDRTLLKISSRFAEVPKDGALMIVIRSFTVRAKVFPPDSTCG